MLPYCIGRVQRHNRASLIIFISRKFLVVQARPEFQAFDSYAGFEIIGMHQMLPCRVSRKKCFGNVGAGGDDGHGVGGGMFEGGNAEERSQT